ncbi:alpha/beta hydrolase fold domain-containing protein [Rhodococcus hoagii]|jgi:acetyl esterase|uniref:alpha/beta hydrolase n=1 Tax=Rhodococcus hoagii TaxID=43767 RepID=UPI0007CD8925|nr:alpha/beta hydrolase [Prescottella equi]MBM4482137.1 alpha/beta hydrolase fold domain-containing protein [Prescottella equi]MBM4535832.1 alpha/beta hydrolase fold domain-containing protein [Prescottella equi]MBM4631833.1 alpha/beta hydrolase fold domain-containing protein [Prescottella equi]NKR81570.1 alpha/beta hydrolase fold domain-containing protein [Prescottella equi]NKS86375.1 alpha/beta hydrolase fold domain-containing protein [Prescottella equi]
MLELDPDVAAYLGTREDWVPMHVAGVQAARTAFESVPQRPGPDMHRVEDRVVDGPHGPLRLRIYHPVDAPDLPALVYFHGGGLVIGSIDSFDRLARLLAVASGAVVVSVDYRLAPEHPYPVATDEAYFATQWVAGNAAGLGIDGDRIAVAGDSAGATLAAGVTLQTRDEGGAPLAFQLHIYAGIDRDDTRPSVLEFADGPIITAGDFAWTKNLYLGDDPSRDHPYGVPSLSADLTGLPAAIVVTASHDPSRDGAEEYAHRLRDAGVQTAVLRYPGVAHGFLMHADLHARARLALAEIGGIMRAKFTYG